MFAFMEELIHLDYALFEWIHHGWQHPWLDTIMPHWREKTSWIPLYLIWAAILIWRYRLRGLYFMMALGVVVGVADFTSSEIIKKSVKRPRPCREVALEIPARGLIGCGGGYSFTSSHATNHFAVAVFLFLAWGRRWKRWRWLLLLWAATIAIGQVYVGVHYPLDIVAGSLVGTTLALLGHAIYRRRAWRVPDFYAKNSPKP